MAVTPLAAGSKVIGKLFGNAVSSAIGFGAGVAMAPALSPAVRDIANAVNSRYSFVFPEPGTLASGVAQGQIDAKTAGRWASYWGVGDSAFKALVDIANTGPGVPVAFDLWRRGVIQEPAFRRAAKRQGLEQEWIDDLVKIKGQLLDPSQVAVMVQRSVLNNPGLLPNQPSTDGSNVPPMPKVDIDPVAEAAGAGIDEARLAAMARIIGLPASPDLAARMHFRDIITEGAFNQAILEGNTRGEWAPFLLEGFRQIPTAHDGIEGRLRGWLDDNGMYAETARHGMSKEDTDLLFKLNGRPPTAHQVFIGLRRGGTYNGPTGHIPQPILKAMQESNLRPEWYNLLYAQIETLPSIFALRTLAQAGDFTADETFKILVDEGWNEARARKVADRWAQGASSAAKEATVTDLLKLYDGGKATHAETLAAIESLGYPAAEAQSKLDTLDASRVVSAKAAAISDLHGKYKKDALPDANAITALHSLGVEAWAAPLIVAAWRTFLTAEAQAPPTALPPTVTGFTPASGPPGSSVTLTGTGFTGASAVHLGTFAASFHVVSAAEITATVPTGATSNQWIVTTPGGTGASGNAFAVT